MVKDTALVTIEGETVPKLSNSTSLNNLDLDLERTQ